MIPIHLDPAAVRIGLVGRGRLALRRLEWLRAGGAAPCVWSDAPEPDFAAAAGESLVGGAPSEAELAALTVLWIADLPPHLAQALAARARALGRLVNVEDVLPLCDFHTPSVVRRGRLTLSAGTGGASPALAQAARTTLAQAFPEAWAEALEEIAEARDALRAAGAAPEAIAADAKARLRRWGLAYEPD